MEISQSISNEISLAYKGDECESHSITDFTSRNFRSWYLKEVENKETFKDKMMSMMRVISQNLTKAGDLESSKPDGMPSVSELDDCKYDFKTDLIAPFYLHYEGKTVEIKSAFSVGRKGEFVDIRVNKTRQISRFQFFLLPTKLISKKDDTVKNVFILIDMTSINGTIVSINDETFISILDNRKYIIFEQNPNIDVGIHIPCVDFVINGKKE